MQLAWVEELFLLLMLSSNVVLFDLFIAGKASSWHTHSYGPIVVFIA